MQCRKVKHIAEANYNWWMFLPLSWFARLSLHVIPEYIARIWKFFLGKAIKAAPSMRFINVSLYDYACFFFFDI